MYTLQGYMQEFFTSLSIFPQLDRFYFLLHHMNELGEEVKKGNMEEDLH
jgi:hypothetical protein